MCVLRITWDLPRAELLLPEILWAVPKELFLLLLVPHQLSPDLPRSLDKLWEGDR